jgi:hypothetical protein
MRSSFPFSVSLDEHSRYNRSTINVRMAIPANNVQAAVPADKAGIAQAELGPRSVGQCRQIVLLGDYRRRNEPSKRHGGKATQYHAAHGRSPRRCELEEAADFVRIRELLTLGTTSEMGQKGDLSHRRDMSVLPPAADMPVNGSFAPEAALGGLEIQLPLYPRKLTQLRNRGMSEKCQKPTSLISHDMNVFPTACCTRNRPSPSTLAERQLDHD